MTFSIRNSLVLIALLPVTLLADEKISQDSEKSAAESAKQWLSLLDQEEYADAWKAMRIPDGFPLKIEFTKDDLAKNMTSLRRKGGKVTSRRVNSKFPLLGRCLFVTFDTSLENNMLAVERVGLLLDKDGTWVVSSYQVSATRPRPEATCRILDEAFGRFGGHQFCEVRGYPETKTHDLPKPFMLASAVWVAFSQDSYCYRVFAGLQNA